MQFFSVTKAPDAVLDYSIDWTKWLNGDSIIDSIWTIPVDSALGIVKSSIGGGLTTVVWVSGGIVGTVVPIVNQIVTTGTRQDSRTILMTIQDK
jgi:hypothetical protein